MGDGAKISAVEAKVFEVVGSKLETYKDVAKEFRKAILELRNDPSSLGRLSSSNPEETVNLVSGARAAMFPGSGN